MSSQLIQSFGQWTLENSKRIKKQESLSESQIKNKVIHLKKKKYSIRKICKVMNLPYSTVQRLLKGSDS